MQNHEHDAPAFHTTNPHSENFTKFENTRLFDRLQKKFTPKPYWKQYQVLRVVVLASSYLFNLLSAATAAALIYFFLVGMIGNEIASGIFTALLLGVLEIAKRETTGRLFNGILQFSKFSAALAGAVLLLTVLSVASSYFGSKRLVTEFTPQAQQISADSLTAPLRAQLDAISTQKKQAAAQTWKGKITAPALRTIERLTKQEETILAELARVQTRIDGKNDSTETEHKADTTNTAGKFALFTLICELLFLLAAFYLEYYDYRSYAEKCKRPAPAPAALDADILPPAPPVNRVYHLRADENRIYTKIVQPPTADNLRTCEHCAQPYTYKHAKQRFCSEQCRINAWQQQTGRTVKKGNKRSVNVT